MDYEKSMEVSAEYAEGEWLSDRLGDEDTDNYCVFCAESGVGTVCRRCGEYKGVMTKADAIKAGYEFCPDCHEMISPTNELLAEYYANDGACSSCYDPTPAGPEYSAGFEMEH